ncbi:MAG TPA: NUDIX domain-containing protein [Dehalococcoidia bacterium]
MQTHLTVTGFVVHGNRTVLRWHRKNQMWLPPGGHVDPDEDPLEALLREVKEETGLEVEVLPPRERFTGWDRPRQIPPPVTILVEEIPPIGEEPAHRHVDLIYFTRALGDTTLRPNPPDLDTRWVDEEEVRRNEGMAVGDCGPAIPLAADVRALALAAIARARELTAG